MATNPFDDLQAHERLMIELQNAVSECHQTTTAARAAIEELALHNTDGVSHPDMRQILEVVGEGNVLNVDERVQQHDENPNAHKTLMDNITKALSDLSSVRSLLDEIIATHNESSTAHSDIREFVSEMRIQLGTGNIVSITESLDKLSKFVNEQVSTNITELQSVDAKHDLSIADMGVDITNMQEDIDRLDHSISMMLVDGVFVSADDLMRTNADVTIADIEDRMGLTEYITDGPNLLDFTSTLPKFLQKNSTMNIAFRGARCKNATDFAKYTIVPCIGNITFEKTDDLEENEPVRINIGEANPGDLIYFRVKVKDPANNKVTEKIIGSPIALPYDLKYIRLSGLPTNIEPGASYDFKIVNALDGAGRCSYTIEPGSTGLIFNKVGTIGYNDVITMEVPVGIRRGIDLTFTLLVHDKFNDTQTRNVTLHVDLDITSENFWSNTPEIVVPGGAYAVKFSGIASANGTPATYNLTDISPSLTFSKTENILPNENVIMAVHDNAPRAQDITFLVRAQNRSRVNSTVDIPQSCRVNNLPSATAVTCTLPEETQGGISFPVKFFNGLDGNGDNTQQVTYEIDPGACGFAFTKMKDITKDDTVMITIPKVATDIIKSFYVWVRDAHGERGLDPKLISIIVHPIYIADTPYIASPQEGREVPVDFTIVWSEFSAHVDMSKSNTEETAFFLSNALNLR